MTLTVKAVVFWDMTTCNLEVNGSKTFLQSIGKLLRATMHHIPEDRIIHYTED
jgi:hypothetical protein